MQIHTYIDHDDLTSDKYNKNIILPISDTTEEKIINNVITYIQEYDYLNLICVCAYLNMIVQTKGLDYIIKIQNNILQGSGFKDNHNNKILIHRYNLLKLIDIVLINKEQLKGKKEVMKNKFADAGGFCLALSLLNSFQHEKNDFVRQLIRDNLLYYENNNYIEHIYKNKILKSILTYRENSINNNWNYLIKDFELKNKICINNYIKFVLGLWKLMKDKFDPLNVDTFYFSKSKFPSYKSIIDLLSESAQDLPQEGLYSVPLKVVGNPILHVNDNLMCILDLKSLIDSNSGLLFLLCKNLNYDFKDIKDKYYSKVTEKVFINILSHLFPSMVDDTSKNDGYPDAIVISGDCLLAFEFTTSEPSFSTIYSGTIDMFIKKYNDILIERENQSDRRPGKLYQIAKQIDKLKTDSKTIYPILVTDSYIGDFDLIDKLDDLMTNCITQNEALSPLKTHKLSILSFDDIFAIWMCIPIEGRANLLISKLNEWNNNTNKGDYLYSFSRFLFQKTSKISGDYLDFYKEKFTFVNTNKKINNSSGKINGYLYNTFILIYRKIASIFTGIKKS